MKERHSRVNRNKNHFQFESIKDESVIDWYTKNFDNSIKNSTNNCDKECKGLLKYSYVQRAWKCYSYCDEVKPWRRRRGFTHIINIHRNIIQR